MDDADQPCRPDDFEMFALFFKDLAPAIVSDAYDTYI